MTARHSFAASLAFCLLSLAATHASAVVCAEGVVREGCAGPRGAVAVKKPVPATVYHPPVAQPPVKCVAGEERAGCVGPRGAAVIRR